LTANEPTIVVATSNPGKAREFAQLLPEGIRILSLRDIGATAPPENGTTFLENATIKALAASRQTDHLVIADDSGICVDVLDGAPGLHSARYAGERATDAQNRDKLLAQLEGVPVADRGAHFQAAVVVACNNMIVTFAEGRVDGAVATYVRGENGFGYDPVFLLPDSRTMAEVDNVEKNQISHRARATHQVLPMLLEAIGKTA
jgi:XTP/dITP diphosphohydrolase